MSDDKQQPSGKLHPSAGGGTSEDFRDWPSLEKAKADFTFVDLWAYGCQLERRYELAVRALKERAAPQVPPCAVESGERGQSGVKPSPVVAAPVEELCKYIKDGMRLCDHGYIYITCGQCVATWLRD